jgi:hypothetical protein
LTPTDHVIRRRESDENCSQRDPNGGWEGSYAASVVQRQAAPAAAAPGVFANGATALVIHTPTILIRRNVRFSLAAYRPCQHQTIRNRPRLPKQEQISRSGNHRRASQKATKKCPTRASKPTTYDDLHCSKMDDLKQVMGGVR